MIPKLKKQNEQATTTTTSRSNYCRHRTIAATPTKITMLTIIIYIGTLGYAFQRFLTYILAWSVEHCPLMNLSKLIYRILLHIL